MGSFIRGILILEIQCEPPKNMLGSCFLRTFIASLGLSESKTEARGVGTYVSMGLVSQSTDQLEKDLKMPVGTSSEISVFSTAQLIHPLDT